MQKKNKRRAAAFVFCASANEQTVCAADNNARKRKFASLYLAKEKQATRSLEGLKKYGKYKKVI